MGLVLMVFSFVIGWRFWYHLQPYTSHWRATPRELGPRPGLGTIFIRNKDGTCVVFSQETEKGVGTSFFVTPAVKTKLLCEQKENGYSRQRFGMLAGRRRQTFAYAVPLDRQLIRAAGRTNSCLRWPVCEQRLKYRPNPPHSNCVAVAQSFAYLTYNHGCEGLEAKDRRLVGSIV